MRQVAFDLLLTTLALALFVRAGDERARAERAERRIEGLEGERATCEASLSRYRQASLDSAKAAVIWRAVAETKQGEQK